MIIEKVYFKTQLTLCLLITFVGISFSQESDSPANPSLLGLAEYGSVSVQNYSSDAKQADSGSTVTEIDNAESNFTNSMNYTANMTAEMTTIDYSQLLFNETANFSAAINATNDTTSLDTGLSSTTLLDVNQTLVNINNSEVQYNSSASSAVFSTEITSSAYNATAVNSTGDSHGNHSSTIRYSEMSSSTIHAWPGLLGTTGVSSHNLELIAADDRAGTVALAVLMSLFVVMIVGLMYYVYHKRQQRLNEHTRIQYRNDGISFENPAYGRKAPF